MNCYEIEGKFKLRSPRQGKLIRGPRWDAYNRQNLGSIPRQVENIILRDHDEENKLAFNSKSPRFPDIEVFSNFVQSSSNGDNGSGGISGSHTENNKKSRFDDVSCHANLSSKPSYSIKGFGNGFASSTERLTYNDIYRQGYLPGPGEYNSSTNYNSKVNANKNSYKRSSSYNKESLEFGVKSNPCNLPGPGYYNISKDLLFTRYRNQNNQNQNSNKLLYSKAMKKHRYNNKSQNQSDELKDETKGNPIDSTSKNQLGPGDYNINFNDISSQNREKHRKLVKDIIALRRENIQNFRISLERNESKQRKIHEKNEVARIVKLYEKSKVSQTEQSNEQVLNGLKHERISQNKSIEKKRPLNSNEDELERFVLRSKVENGWNLNEIERVKTNKYDDLQTLKRREEEILHKLKLSKENLSSFFKSASKKSLSILPNRHNPGPSYYNPVMVPPYLSFNVKTSGDIWI